MKNNDTKPGIADLMRRAYKWLLPGMKIKRWIFLSWVGLSLFSVGVILFIESEPFITLELKIAEIFGNILNRSIDTRLVDIAFIITGLILLLVGIRQWFVSIYRAVVPNEQKSLVDVIYEKRHLGQGLKIATIGGGTGLSSLLRGIKKYTSNITAVVTVADDGGSSGRLRKEMGVLPPGDIRNCLVALADEESLMGDLFQYRFTDGNSLVGHSFGNLFIAAMTSISGDFDKAVKQSSKILAIKGRVLPATLSPVTLCSKMEDGSIVEGESSITKDERKIDSIFLKPDDCSPPSEVLESIQNADLIVLGPGSLYTSVLPNLLIKGIVEAINSSRATTLYVCNVMTQPGETDGYKASDHLKAIFKTAPGLRIDYCLVNVDVAPSSLLEKYENKSQFPVEADVIVIEEMGVKPITASLLQATDLVRHNSETLAERIAKLMDEISSSPV